MLRSSAIAAATPNSSIMNVVRAMECATTASIVWTFATGASGSRSRNTRRMSGTSAAGDPLRARATSVSPPPGPHNPVPATGTIG
jgi:hypothetical protein